MMREVAFHTSTCFQTQHRPGNKKIKSQVIAKDHGLGAQETNCLKGDFI